MLGQVPNYASKLKARRLSRSNSKQNPLSDLDNICEPDCKRIKVEDPLDTGVNSEEPALPGCGENVPDGTGSWGDVSLYTKDVGV